MHLALDLAALALVLVVLAAAIWRWCATPGPAILTAFRNSATIAVGEATKILGSGVVLLDSYGDLFADPTFSALLTSFGFPDRSAGIVIAAIGFAVNAARKRTLAAG
jgi:hypothetical protein